MFCLFYKCLALPSVYPRHSLYHAFSFLSYSCLYISSPFHLMCFVLCCTFPPACFPHASFPPFGFPPVFCLCSVILCRPPLFPRYLLVLPCVYLPLLHCSVSPVPALCVCYPSVTINLVRALLAFVAHIINYIKHSTLPSVCTLLHMRIITCAVSHRVFGVNRDRMKRFSRAMVGQTWRSFTSSHYCAPSILVGLATITSGTHSMEIVWDSFLSYYDPVFKADLTESDIESEYGFGLVSARKGSDQDLLDECADVLLASPCPDQPIPG